MTIVEFLDARLKEDLVGAAITPPHPDWHDRMNHGEHLVRIIATLRAIVAEHSESEPSRPQRYCIVCASGDGNGEDWPCEEIRTIATVYSDHPDYQQEWKP